MAEPTTKPGDLVGHDRSGRVRIDRVIPLPWLLGGMVLVAAQGIASYYQLQQATEQVREVRVRLDAIVSWQSLAQISEAEQRAEMRDLRRRVEQLEARRP